MSIISTIRNRVGIRRTLSRQACLIIDERGLLWQVALFSQVVRDELEEMGSAPAVGPREELLLERLPSWAQPRIAGLERAVGRLAHVVNGRLADVNALGVVQTVRLAREFAAAQADIEGIRQGIASYRGAPPLDSVLKEMDAGLEVILGKLDSFLDDMEACSEEAASARPGDTLQFRVTLDLEDGGHWDRVAAMIGDVAEELEASIEALDSEAAGYVYVMTNASFEALLKIGITRRTPQERAAELSASTGVPMPFEVAYSKRVADCREAERRVHRRLDCYRVSADREFFRCTLDEAVAVLTEVQ